MAVGQEGHFTTQQAAGAGYSPQLLQKYLRNGRVIRVRRGVYRIVHYPAGQHEDLVALWLWSGQPGVFSHETALMLHDLSDALPSKAHLTLPSDWRTRRLRVPKGVVLH
jgi:predicted transcriptional regulator of viral defense system